MGRRERYIWVQEDLDEHGPTGSFSTEGLTGESLEAALARARARSGHVIVSFAEGEEYSAGSKPVPGLPSWPPA